MRRHMPLLAALFLAGVTTIFSLGNAYAGSHIAWPQTAPLVAAQSAPVVLAGYYGHSDYDSGYDDHQHGPNCGHYGYKKKYVCEYTERRCYKQRECIWHYGREYCRYVKKCHGGEKYCKWITVRANHYY